MDTKRSTAPSRSRPATIITTPVSTDSVNSAVAGSLAECTAGTSVMIIAIAPVPWIAMNTELVAAAPATVPTR